jgi:spermidine synthase
LHRRLANYWKARNRFLHLGVGVPQTGDVRQLFGRIGEPLLKLVKLSPDFDPAYRPLLTMAQALRPIDAGASQSLLLRLAKVNPQRAEAQRLLARLFK